MKGIFIIALNHTFYLYFEVITFKAKFLQSFKFKLLSEKFDEILTWLSYDTFFEIFKKQERKTFIRSEAVTMSQRYCYRKLKMPVQKAYVLFEISKTAFKIFVA